MVKQIKFVIDANGKVELSVSGITGNGCEKLTLPFEERLGLTKERQYKDSYYQCVESEQVGLENRDGNS